MIVFGIITMLFLFVFLPLGVIIFWQAGDSDGGKDRAKAGLGCLLILLFMGAVQWVAGLLWSAR